MNVFVPDAARLFPFGSAQRSRLCTCSIVAQTNRLVRVLSVHFFLMASAPERTNLANLCYMMTGVDYLPTVQSRTLAHIWSSLIPLQEMNIIGESNILLIVSIDCCTELMI